MYLHVGYPRLLEYVDQGINQAQKLSARWLELPFVFELHELILLTGCLPNRFGDFRRDSVRKAGRRKEPPPSDAVWAFLYHNTSCIFCRFRRRTVRFFPNFPWLPPARNYRLRSRGSTLLGSLMSTGLTPSVQVVQNHTCI